MIVVSLLVVSPFRSLFHRDPRTPGPTISLLLVNNLPSFLKSLDTKGWRKSYSFTQYLMSVVCMCTSVLTRKSWTTKFFYDR